MRELSFQREHRRYLFPVSIFRPGAADMTSFAATALLDTGATASGIGPAVIAALGLRSHMKKRLRSATDEVFVDYYLFRIGLYTSVQMANVAESIQEWPFLFDAVEGFSWSRPGDFDMIIGMDVLSNCDVALSRDGTCRLSFG